MFLRGPRLADEGVIRDGARISILVKLGPWKQRWDMEHLGYVEGRQFQDRMRSGPMSYWLHTHSMTPEGNGSLMEDRIQYKPPLGALGNFVAGGLVRNKLARLFRYLYAKLAGD